MIPLVPILTVVAAALADQSGAAAETRYTIVLLSCTKSKDPRAKDRPIPAREIYAPSALFRGGVRYAERRGAAWAVLSAKHGLLLPTDLVAHYDETLIGAPRKAREAWARRVIGQMAEQGWLEGGELGIGFQIHAGESYVHPLAEMLRERGVRVELPLEGKTMGQRLSLYKNDAVEAVDPLAAWEKEGATGRLIGWRVMRYDPASRAAVSAADSRQSVSLVPGHAHQLAGKGMFLSPDQSYVVRHYANHDDGENVLMKYAFRVEDVTSGSLFDREPEISVSRGTLLWSEVF